jgi:[ribosomal protein S18]-alanine N-acetyltransferase
MKIRPAITADLPAVVETERASFTTPWSERTFVSLVSNDSVLFRVVEDYAGNVIGHGVVWWVLDEAELANLAVAPRARRAGVGRRLLDALLAEVALRGVTRVFLEVRESNTAAQELYAGRGFEPVGVRRDYYLRPREDARVLKLELNGLGPASFPPERPSDAMENP